MATTAGAGGGAPPPNAPGGGAPGDEPPAKFVPLCAAIKVLLAALVAGTLPVLARPGKANKDDQLLNNYIHTALEYRSKKISAGLATFRRHAQALQKVMGHVVMLSILVELLREVCQEAAAARAAAAQDDVEDESDSES